MEWRAIPDFPDYEVSDSGLIRRLNGILRRAHPVSGYLKLALRKDGKYHQRFVHRLVCHAFHGAPPNSEACAAHGDGNKLNNCAANLRWASRAENERDKWRHGRMSNGERHGHAKFNDVDIERMRDIRRAGMPLKAVSSWIGASDSHVSQVCAGLKRRHATCVSTS